ncbi:MAG: LCP family protein [Clostridia bacterium]|nr:LCP family protein [Clostridia bacterium]
MDKKDNFDLNFNEKYEDIIAAMQKKDEETYEDIVSDSSYQDGNIKFEDISSNSVYKKKSRGIKGWWNALTSGKKIAFVSISATSLIALILAFVIFIAPILSPIFSAIIALFGLNHRDISGDLGYTDIIDKNVVNVALFGVDSRDEEIFSGNTDSIMILSINTKTKKIKIFSIMRDTLVPMEYEGKSYFGKINSAYTKGPEHAIKTLNQAFGLDISEYATVNFYGMVDIIDAVGGIPATITQDELTWKGNDRPNLNNCMDEICKEMGLDPKDYYIHTAGDHVLNGVQAVAYSRVRYCRNVWGTNNDYGRTDRQRHVMQGLFNKATSMSKSQYPELIKALIPCTETSLSYGDILSLATSVLLGSPSFEQYRLPPSEYQSDFLMTAPSGYGSVIYYDLDYAEKLINAVIYDDVTIEQFIEENPIENNDWYSDMGGKRYPSNSSQQQNSSEEPIESEQPDDTSSDDTSSDDTSSDDTSSDDTTSEDEETSSGDTTSDDTSDEQDSSDDESSSSEESTSSEDPESQPTEQEPAA